MSKASKKDPAKSRPQNKSSSVKALRDKHLKDKDHIITDEDLKSLDVNTTREDTETSHVPDLPEDKDRPKDEDKDPKRVTPWDVIE
ncbi:MAG TPA: hypothetical protein VF476_03360 [Chitinophagaceae bacterium]